MTAIGKQVAELLHDQPVKYSYFHGGSGGGRQAINAKLLELGFPCEAELAREDLSWKELKRVRRMLTEYGLSGWDMSDILQDDKELHDKIKKREK